MPTDFDAYRILQVEPGASQDEIDDAFDRLRAGAAGEGSELQDRRRALDAAYAVLRDPEQRRAYDERRAAEPPPPPEDGAYEALFPEAAAASQPAKAPWGVGDILKAIGVVVLGLIAVSVPIAILADAIADGDIEDDALALTLTLLGSLLFEFVLVGAVLLFSMRKYRIGWPALGLRRQERGPIWFPLGLTFSALFLLIVYGLFLEVVGLTPDADLPEEIFDNVGPLAVVIVLTVLLAPIAEEIFFRGFIFGGLEGRWGFWPAAVASGTLFAIAHIGNPGYLPVLPAIAAIGVLFAWGYRYTGSLLPVIAAHLLFNTISLSVGIATS